MKKETERILNEIDEAHDWAIGQAWGGGGTLISSTDTCRLCGLRRHYTSDHQNGNDGSYRFSDGETGEDLSLRQAYHRGCGI